ncbi:tripartite tricarboxylate transporter substrate binding protein [Variovorax sp. LjRoot130]|uniref:tripartite tricarboxylate transporter substrate binding protein n=1 Tax=Variovorax sp. LjRoot130 TaxID=3342261 RepID=UPI003ECFDA89
MLRSLLTSLALALAAAAWPAHATYPDRPVTLIVPFAPGGGADAMGRAIGLYLEKRLKQPVVVANRPGAGGQIGFTAIAKAKPDGYTIGIITAPNVVVFPLQRPTQYKLSEFALIANLVEDDGMFFVRKESPFKSMPDVVAYAKANPGKVTVGTTGEGSLPHLTMLALEQKAGIQLTAVHYAGAAPTRMGILAGDLDMAYVTAVDGAGDLRAGMVRALGVTARKRLNSIPTAPTLVEQGYDVVTSASRGLAAPAGTPEDVLKLLRSAVADASKDPAFVEIAHKQGMPLHYMDHETFAKDLLRQQQEYSVVWKERVSK